MFTNSLYTVLDESVCHLPKAISLRPCFNVFQMMHLSHCRMRFFMTLHKRDLRCFYEAHNLPDAVGYICKLHVRS